MMGAVIRRALEHPEFRTELMKDTRAALESHGFALNDEDFAALSGVLKGAGGDSEIARYELIELAGKYGIDPEDAMAAEREG